MQEYINRLARCGVSAAEAIRLCKAMVRDFSFAELEELIAEIERDSHVERIQP